MAIVYSPATSKTYRLLDAKPEHIGPIRESDAKRDCVAGLEATRLSNDLATHRLKDHLGLIHSLRTSYCLTTLKAHIHGSATPVKM